MKTILIVNKRQHNNKKDLINYLAQRWESMGFRVIIHEGPEDLPPADIAILHVNNTIVPQIYPEALADYPVVINRNILNISRDRYSMISLTRDSGFKGPVIIKTNANYGGMPEYKEIKKDDRKPQGDWRTRQRLNPMKYPIYKRLEDVPHGAWENPHLIIEKFLPEIERNFFFRKYFFVRYWSFFGDISLSGRFGSRNPISKFKNKVTEDIPVEIPSFLVDKRQELQIDYGRFDFVIHKGQTILLDVNKTLGVNSGTVNVYSDFLDNLAQGIKNFI